MGDGGRRKSNEVKGGWGAKKEKAANAPDGVCFNSVHSKEKTQLIVDGRSYKGGQATY